MPNRVLVGNLPFEMTESALEQIFSSAGRVRSVSLITDIQTGRRKGFALVEMGDRTEAQRAVQLMDGKEDNNRKLIVNLAFPSDQNNKVSFLQSIVRRLRPL